MMQDLHDGALACIRVAAARCHGRKLKVLLTAQERAELVTIEKRYKARRWISSKSVCWNDPEEACADFSCGAISPIRPKGSRKRFDLRHTSSTRIEETVVLRQQFVFVTEQMQTLFSQVWRVVFSEDGECPDLRTMADSRDPRAFAEIVQRVVARLTESGHQLHPSVVDLINGLRKEIHQYQQTLLREHRFLAVHGKQS
jgi:hypothetical protein